MTKPEYVELHTHSYYSLLDGISSPSALLARAAEVGMPALALTDHDAVYGVVPFATEARQKGIRPILGAELTLEGDYHLTLLVEDAVGWANLCTLISRARANAPKGSAVLPRALLEEHTDGLVALSGCRQGLVASALLQDDPPTARQEAQWLKACFGERLWLEVQHHYRPDDTRLVRWLVEIARKEDIPLVATNNVHYATRDHAPLQDVVTAIRHSQPLSAIRGRLRPNSNYYLKSADEMARPFQELPQALANTLVVAERCTYTPPSELQTLPPYPVPEGFTAQTYVRHLCEAALPGKIPHDPARAQAQVKYELGIVERAGLANYFLVVWDIVRFAREHNILCQGRGSACNSLIAYLLDISPIDPLTHGLVFERFLSDERNSAPDIDLDIAADRREEVIQYVYARYGRDHAAMACTFSRYQLRGALRDVGKALDIPLPMLNRVIKLLDRRTHGIADSPELTTLAQQGVAWQHLQTLAESLLGSPRHLGIHNGGMILTAAPLTDRLPTEPATMPGRTVTQWDKDQFEELAFIKVDLLGLRMLSVIAEAIRAIEAATGQSFDWATVPLDDPAIYAMLSRGDTVGVFQLESRAQAQVLPRLKPTCFADLLIAISLIRPGPLVGNMTHPYLRRRAGQEAVTFPHPSLEDALGETLGVVLFQEQVLKVVTAFTGLTPGEGEQIRRAFGKRHVDTTPLQRKFWAGARKKGVRNADIQAVWDLLKAFGGYAFAKSHAAAFAVLVYRSAWLKCYYPAAFASALLNNQPMGFWSPAVIVNDAKRHGVQVINVDINTSAADCTVTGNMIQIGLSYVRGLGKVGAAHIVRRRGAVPFANLADLCQRTNLPRTLIENLITAGAMDAWGARRTLLWQLREIVYAENAFLLEIRGETVVLPPLSEVEEQVWEVEMTGLSARDHLLHAYRPWLQERGLVDSRTLATLRSGTTVAVAGELRVHQAPPTAKGTHFVTLEDEYGLMNLILHPTVYPAYRTVLRESVMIIAVGRVQRREGGVVNIAGTQVLTLQLPLL